MYNNFMQAAILQKPIQLITNREQKIVDVPAGTQVRVVQSVLVSGAAYFVVVVPVTGWGSVVAIYPKHFFINPNQQN
jgi:MinD superfamily P-loop ATPase